MRRSRGQNKTSLTICAGLEALGYKRDEYRTRNASTHVVFLDHVAPGNRRLYVGRGNSLRGGSTLALSIPLDDLKSKAIAAAKEKTS